MAPSADAHASHATEFIEKYSRVRGFPKEKDLTTPQLVDAVRRAESARERYKLANAADEPPTDAPEDVRRHLRRLANNRRSAAAARVYHEVLRVECAHALNAVSHRAEVAQRKVAALESRREALRLVAVSMRARIASLETRVKGISKRTNRYRRSQSPLPSLFGPAQNRTLTLTAMLRIPQPSLSLPPPPSLSPSRPALRQLRESPNRIITITRNRDPRLARKANKNS